ncbi:aspartate aminotransferase family protein [Rhodoligotrophos appendicifer]|uniref:aspartate aminotransferase family protein n=1 Tax=Rhodoligotrophos appendicifer TaxID=987056 RepID=UPI001180C701|nr:aspartate aminotransferase family protein [Rhodoligotrophos appendicifer]
MSRKPREILALNAFDAGNPAPLAADVQDLLARRDRSFGATSMLFYEEPLHVVSASGVHLHTADGRTYLDLYNNVPSVGHCHPRVVDAVSRQMGLLNSHTRYLYDVLHDYAERLLATFSAPLTNVAFTCTGSESNDLALRLARGMTGSTGVIVTETAYHGNTTAVTEVSPSSYKRGRPPSYVRTIPAPDARHYGSDIGAGLAAAVTAEIETLRSEGFGFAALLVDSIFSSDGIFSDPAGFLAPAVAAAHEAGGLFIADEVQPGFGRTGDGMWGYDRHGVRPDIVTLGKPMGNGFPMGAVVTRPEILTRFAEEFGYFNTFGGNPVASAAGIAVLDVIADEGLIDNARTVGAQLKQGLVELAKDHAGLGEIRGTGLYLGVEIAGEGGPDAEAATRLINGLRRKGILIGAAGRFGNVLKIRPPLCLTRGHGDEFLTVLDELLGATGQS